MKKSWKIAGALLVLGIFAIAAMISVTPTTGSDPTGAAYVAATGAETLSEVATTASKAYYGANFTWINAYRLHGILLPVRIRNG